MSLSCVIYIKVLKFRSDRTIQQKKPRTANFCGSFIFKNCSMRKKQGPVQTAVGPYGSLLPFESEPTKKQKKKKKKSFKFYSLQTHGSHGSSQSLKKKNYLQAYISRSPLLQLQTCCQTLRLEITSQFLPILLLYIALSCSFSVSVFFIFSSLLLFLCFCLLYLPLFSCYFLFLPSHLLNLTVNHSLYSWPLILIWWTKQCFPFSPFQASSFSLLERLDWVESG